MNALIATITHNYIRNIQILHMSSPLTDDPKSPVLRLPDRPPGGSCPRGLLAPPCPPPDLVELYAHLARVDGVAPDV